MSLDGAERALAEGRAADAIELLLAVWRTTRDRDLAELIELVSLRPTMETLPELAKDAWHRSTWGDMVSWDLHPWYELPAPDPRATRPRVLEVHQVLGCSDDPKPSVDWLDRTERMLRAHGDPRTGTLLARLAHGKFGDWYARLQRVLPPAQSLAPAEADCVRRMMTPVADEAAAVATELARKSWWPVHQQLATLGLPYWLPTLAWYVPYAIFERGICTEVSLRMHVETLRAVLGTTDWRTVRTLNLWGDRFSTADQQLWTAPDRGVQIRNALVALLRVHHFESVHGVATELISALAANDIRVRWRELQAYFDARFASALIALDPPLESLSLWEEVHAQFASPSRLDELWSTSVGGRLRALELDVPVEHWSSWVTADALPPHIERMRLRTKRHDYDLAAAREAHGWMLAFELHDRWENFDSEFEDPPTPGANLLAFLESLDLHTCTGIIVRDLAELDNAADRERLITAALRQRDLTRLVVPQLDGCDEHEELDTCPSCGAPPRLRV